MPSAVSVFPVPGGPCRTAIITLAPSYPRQIMWPLCLTNETFALALDDIVDAFGGVVFM